MHDYNFFIHCLCFHYSYSKSASGNIPTTLEVQFDKLVSEIFFLFFEEVKLLIKGFNKSEYSINSVNLSRSFIESCQTVFLFFQNGSSLQSSLLNEIPVAREHIEFDKFYLSPSVSYLTPDGAVLLFFHHFFIQNEYFKLFLTLPVFWKLLADKNFLLFLVESYNTLMDERNSVIRAYKLYKILQKIMSNPYVSDLFESLENNNFPIIASNFFKSWNNCLGSETGREIHKIIFGDDTTFIFENGFIRDFLENSTYWSALIEKKTVLLFASGKVFSFLISSPVVRTSAVKMINNRVIERFGGGSKPNEFGYIKNIFDAINNFFNLNNKPHPNALPYSKL